MQQRRKNISNIGLKVVLKQEKRLKHNLVTLKFVCSLQLQFFTFRMLTCSHFLSVLQVRRVLKVLEKPFSSQPGLELPECMGGSKVPEQGERDEGEERQQEAASTSRTRNPVPYDSKPPAWANEICVT